MNWFIEQLPERSLFPLLTGRVGIAHSGLSCEPEPKVKEKQRGRERDENSSEHFIGRKRRTRPQEQDESSTFLNKLTGNYPNIQFQNTNSSVVVRSNSVLQQMKRSN